MIDDVYDDLRFSLNNFVCTSFVFDFYIPSQEIAFINDIQYMLKASAKYSFATLKIIF